MEREQRNIIDFLVSCIGAFAERFSVTNKYAYDYLNRYQGFAFLYKHYRTEHTLSIDDCVDDAVAICVRHGGMLQ